MWDYPRPPRIEPVPRRIRGESPAVAVGIRTELVARVRSEIRAGIYDTPEKFDLLDRHKVSTTDAWAHLAIVGDEIFVREFVVHLNDKMANRAGIRFFARAFLSCSKPHKT